MSTPCRFPSACLVRLSRSSPSGRTAPPTASFWSCVPPCPAERFNPAALNHGLARHWPALVPGRIVRDADPRVVRLALDRRVVRVVPQLVGERHKVQLVQYRPLAARQRRHNVCHRAVLKQTVPGRLVEDDILFRLVVEFPQGVVLKMPQRQPNDVVEWRSTPGWSTKSRRTTGRPCRRPGS